MAHLEGLAHLDGQAPLEGRSGLIVADERIGDVFLDEAEIRTRVAELGAEIGRDYAGREPIVVGSLKACLPFVCDLARALPILHALDFVELAGYDGAGTGGHQGIRFLKDLDTEIEDRHVLLVDEVVDTGLTMNYLAKSLSLRRPASLAAAALFDRPYRRLVDDLPVNYVGFTIPDAFFVGYGFDLEERFRNLPNLHALKEF